MKVISTILKINSIIYELSKFIITLVKYDDRITIPTFTKLFDISIVANNFSGLFNRFIILFELSNLSFFSCLIVDGDNEKYATSEPEINADISIKNIIKIEPITWFTLKLYSEI